MRPQLDFELYNYAEKKLDASINAYGAAEISEAAAAIKALNTAFDEFCGCEDLGREERAFCKWVSMTDIQYEHAISPRGVATPVRLSWLHF